MDLLHRQMRMNQIYGELLRTLTTEQVNTVDSCGLCVADPIGHKLEVLRRFDNLSSDTKFYMHKLESFLKGGR